MRQERELLEAERIEQVAQAVPPERVRYLTIAARARGLTVPRRGRLSRAHRNTVRNSSRTC